MAKLNIPRATALAAALSTALASPVTAAADEANKLDTPKAQYDEYHRDTSVPQVPAATLLGVDKSKIVEVASVSTFATTLSSARRASSEGTPFGIDIAPYLFLAGANSKVTDAIKANRYVSDPWVRLMARTRLSYATAQTGNSAMRAWGIYTRPIDLRDPFVDPGLERCLATFRADRNDLKVKSQPPGLPDGTQELASADRFRVILNAAGARTDDAEYLQIRKEMKQFSGAESTTYDAMKPQIDAWYERLVAANNPAEFKAKETALQAKYETCSKTAVDKLVNRSYLAVGYSQGSARAVDDSQPVDLRPGAAWWMTFVYGFEGLDKVFGSASGWKDSIKNKAISPSTLEGSARLTLHVARTLKASKRVDDVDQNTAGTLLGLGFDYAFMDAHRASAQLTHSRLGEGTTRSTERRAVVGLDFRIQQGLWFGLSWARVDSTLGGKQNEAKAALKRAFSDKSWLPSN